MNTAEILIALRALLIREVRRFVRIWIQTLLPPAITVMLYFLIFGKVIGDRIGDMQGVSYIEFVVPGLIMMAVITNAYANVVASFFSAKFQRSIEELLVSPLPNAVILAGFVGGGLARGMMVGAIVMLVSLVFVDIHLAHPWIVLSMITLASTLFSLLGFINAVYARTFDDISIVPSFVLTPLTYLGGVFFPLSALSGFWQTLSMFNPVLYIINAFRYGMLGITDVNIALSFMMTASFTLAAAIFALVLLHRGTGLRH